MKRRARAARTLAAVVAGGAVLAGGGVALALQAAGEAEPKPSDIATAVSTPSLVPTALYVSTGAGEEAMTEPSATQRQSERAEGSAEPASRSRPEPSQASGSSRAGGEPEEHAAEAAGSPEPPATPAPPDEPRSEPARGGPLSDEEIRARSEPPRETGSPPPLGGPTASTPAEPVVVEG